MLRRAGHTIQQAGSSARRSSRWRLLDFSAPRHLTAYQLGYINRVWDLFFLDGTKRVLDPTSLAPGLGALSYMLEVVAR